MAGTCYGIRWSRIKEISEWFATGDIISKANSVKSIRNLKIKETISAALGLVLHCTISCCTLSRKTYENARARSEDRWVRNIYECREVTR